MSRRTRLKLNNIQRFLAKNVFTTRYIVRNTLVVMIVCALAAITAVMVYVAKEKNRQDEKTAIIYVGEEEITTEEVSLIDGDTILVLKEELGAQYAAKQAVEVQTVAQSNDYGRFVVTADSLNVRAEADESSDIIGRLAGGATGEVTGVSGDWTGISSGGISGYVKTEYILTGAEAENELSAAVRSIATVTASSVRVRSEASTDSDIIITVSAGYTFVVDDTFSDTAWTRVRLADYTYGYVASEYLSIAEGYEEAVSIDIINGLSEAREAAETQTAADDTDKDTDSASDKDDKTQSVASDKTTQSGGKSESTAQSQPTETVKTESQNSTEAAASESDNSNEITVTTTSRGSFGLSDEDIYLLACIVYAEAGGESYDGQLAVANVVLNRLQSGRWGSTVSDVIYASGQFTAVNSSAFTNAQTNGPGSTALSVAQAAAGGTNNVGSFASFRPVRSANTSSYSSYTIIGNHCFF